MIYEPVERNTVSSVEPPRPRCDTLITSKPYFIAECVARGMATSNHSDNAAAALAVAKKEYDNLGDCASGSLDRLQQMADVSSTKIINSGVISPLMDFSDAIRLECSKAADPVFNENSAQGN
ncbi:MAG: hypothetical protein WBB34_02065 [Xanthobacteraceae bacterium]